MPRSISVWMLLVCSCHEPEGEPPESTPMADFGELCGQDEPVRLLALAPDEWPVWDTFTLPWRERQLFLIERCADDACSSIASTTLVTSGRCGEDRVSLDVPELVQLLPLQPAFSKLVGCTNDETLVVIDLEAGAVRPVLEGAGCRTDALGEGLVALRGDPLGPFELWYVPSLHEVAPSSVFLNIEVRAPRHERHIQQVMRVAAGEVFVVDGGGRLLVVDPASAAKEVLAEGVAELFVTDDGRFVAWSEIEPYTQGWDNYPAWLLDRESGQRLEAGWGSMHMSRQYPGFTQSRADPGLGGRRVILLPEMETLTLPQRWVDWRLDDGRILVNGPESDRFVLDPDTGAEQFLADRQGLLLQTPWGYDLFSFGHDPMQLGRDIWRTHLDGTPPTLAASDVVGHQRVGPRKVAGTVCDEGYCWGRDATVLLFDEDLEAPTMVATEASMPSSRGTPLHGLGANVVVFGVQDQQRAGIWAVAFD